MALALVSAVSLANPSRAGTVYGSWSGVVTVTTMEYLNGQNLGITETGYYPAPFSLSYDSDTDDLTISINGTEINGEPYPVFFGPQNADGSIYLFFNLLDGNGWAGDFFVTYKSILPGGMIDTSTGGAVADITVFGLDGTGSGDVTYTAFSTVPEPSSIALGALSILLVAISACAWCVM